VSRADADQIPNELDLVIDFVNTLDVETAVDAIATPKELGRWLARRGLLARSARVSAAQHASAIALREALRATMRANNRGGSADSAWAEIEQAARDGELAVHFAPSAGVSVAPRAEGVTGALSALLVPVAAAIADGSWPRVKACRSGDCEWAFYDRSRNRSATWCEMEVCGNRTKVRAYRARGARGVSHPAR
jgi:predicted RNA-binding Zn ribbon-like protein